ncbi:hypothetical protein UFOVP1400_21 [uncultured Caudovirales phage]|uniref:Uncharacterized protein n=2 Tax=uncultured Caudovirales phage TaxID=2100421 RepID=A0A6J5QAL1_9CAUD|nr:hypothetical protein UFOVP561_2 [uncultured Caudovirales phage]CAB4181103.1 hypothetical protein UFOVP1060_16 [uncultured Caudovirales phage]CAB4204611.1 hypothetical protein UFOVP1400_21 [uncultured Caudovirales phage]
MAGVAVIGSGNYDLEIDTGYMWDAFTLDDDLKGELNNTEYVLDGISQYASVMDGTIGLTAKRGRQNTGDQFAYGTMSFTLNDTYADGVFNPFDTTSPYYDPANDQPGLAPLRQVRFSRYDSLNVKKYLWVGYIVNYDYTFTLGGLDTVTVNCADFSYQLGQTFLAEWNVTEQLSSERFDDLLDLPEVAYTGTRSIETGVATLGGAAAWTVANGTSVAGYANKINEAEQGRIFVDREGTMTFQKRLGTTLGVPIAEFHDDDTNIGYSAIDISFQADTVVNRASIQHAGASSPQVAEDLVSQAAYLVQTQSITDSLLHNDAAALTLAEYLISPDPEARFNFLGTEFPGLSTADQETLALLDVGDLINVQKSITTSAGPTQFAQNLTIEGLEHRLTLSAGHAVTYFTAPTTIVYELILDDIVYGTLDEDNVLG